MDKIQQFFFDKWAIEERRYHQLLSILLPGLKNGNLASVEQYLGAKRIEAYAAVPYVAGRWELDDASLPQGAVVVLTCEGVLYSWETYRLERYISPQEPISSMGEETNLRAHAETNQKCAEAHTPVI